MKNKINIFIVIVIVTLCGCKKNGFITERNDDDFFTYYYINGEKQTGWKEIEGEKYYFYKENEPDINGQYILGSMKQGTWLKEGEDYYYFGLDGRMLRNGAWELKDGNVYYFDSTGKMLHNTEKVIDGAKYIFGSDGKGKKAPYYSNPTWNINIYLNNDLSKPIYVSRSNVVAWKLHDISMSVRPSNNGLILCVNGIAEFCEFKKVYGGYDMSQKPDILCRLTMIDDKGVTSSTSGMAKGSEISVGQKTYVTWEIGYLPLFGGDINAEFCGPQ